MVFVKLFGAGEETCEIGTIDTKIIDTRIFSLLTSGTTPMPVLTTITTEKVISGKVHDLHLTDLHLYFIHFELELNPVTAMTRP